MRLFLTFLALAALALAAGLYTAVRDDGRPEVLTPLAAPGVDQQRPPADAPAASAVGDRGGRRAIAAAPAELPPATLEVRLVPASGSAGSECAVDDQEIQVRAAAAADPAGLFGYAAGAATDRDGVARFCVPGPTAAAAGHFAVRAGSAGPQYVDLAPGQHCRLDIRLTPALTVAGTVVDAARRPLPDAEIVFVAPAPTAGDWQPLRIGRCDAAGRFCVALARDGYLGARYPGARHAAASRIAGATALATSELEHTATLPRDGGAGVARAQFHLLPPGPAVHGTVFDPAGRPAPHVAVLLRPAPESMASPTPGRQPQACLEAAPQLLTSDGGGRFASAPLPPGPFVYEALAPDGMLARGAFAANRANGLRIRLGPPASVHGRVRSADGRPLATAVSSGETGDLLATRADCDADGVYALAGLPAGEVELIARSSHAALARTFALAAGERRRWDPLLAGAAAAAARELCGLVVGPGRRPLADWTVIVRQLEPAASTVLQSGSDGRFAIACEADRRFDVLVYEPSQPPSGFAAATRADCSPDDGLLLLAVDPDLPAATLAGRLRTPTGEVAAATVYCWHRDRGQTVEVAADDGGAFEFRGVPPGDVIVACRCAGFLAPHLELVLGAGERRDLGVIALRAGAIVSGRVTATDGKPLRDLAVAIETADGSRLAATCSDAGFRFEAVPAGRHRLLVHGDGIAASAVPIAVEAGVELVQDIRVEPGVSRAISVHDPLGSGGRVTLELGRAGEPRALVLAGGGADPRPVEFTACMPPGTYDAVAWNEAGRRGKARVTFTAGGAPPVAIELRER